MVDKEPTTGANPMPDDVGSAQGELTESDLAKVSGGAAPSPPKVVIKDPPNLGSGSGGTIPLVNADNPGVTMGVASNTIMPLKGPAK